MRLQITSQTTIDVPAVQAWHVLAHQFDQLGQWTSLIPQSQPVSDIPVPDGALVGGRVCSPAVAGFRAVQERFTNYDEAGMRFSYAATVGLPWLITRAENHWSVRPLSPNRSLVEARAELALRRHTVLTVTQLDQLAIPQAPEDVGDVDVVRSAGGFDRRGGRGPEHALSRVVAGDAVAWLVPLHGRSSTRQGGRPGRLLCC
ncbi:MAG TPA: SRPBCC family protein [Chloroflexaceae bacterium]|nr:SRPBCC family protein [Chloroflexaceae bacterium]